jgi:anti-sigma factor RsiW
MPFKSKAQRRLFYAKMRAGEIAPEVVKKWALETQKDIPEKKKMKKSAAFEVGMIDVLEKEARGRLGRRKKSPPPRQGRVKADPRAARAAAPKPAVKVSRPPAKAAKRLITGKRALIAGGLAGLGLVGHKVYGDMNP